MSQPATWGVPLVSPATPTAMAARMDDSLDAVLSAHSGATRPAYAVTGTIWHDDDLAAANPLLMFDGTVDRRVIVETADGDAVITNDLTVVGGDLIVTAGDLIVTASTTPASATATGVAGTIAWDADFVYVCTATDTWKRVAIATW